MTLPAGTSLSESLEDYLEAIYQLERRSGAARPADIAARLDVSRPSVTGALRALSERGLVHYAPYAAVALTSAGRKTAAEVARRHGILKEFLERVLSLPADQAERAACRMEHVLEADVLTRFLDFARFTDSCPYRTTRWIAGTGFVCSDKGTFPACAACSVPG
jgi:DtxR family Mn-dependent transcriptional regulator